MIPKCSNLVYSMKWHGFGVKRTKVKVKGSLINAFFTIMTITVRRGFELYECIRYGV